MKTLNSYFFTFLLLLASVSFTALPNTYYVSPSGNNSNPGTEAQPWKTITYAVSGSSPVAGPGDTVIVKPGLYIENIYLDKSGAPGNPFVLKGEGNFMNGDVTLEDPTPTGGPEYRYGIIKAVLQHDIVIDNFKAQFTNGCGIALESCTNVTVQNIYTYKTGCSGIIAMPKDQGMGGEAEIQSFNIKVLDCFLEDASYHIVLAGKLINGLQEGLSIWGVDGFEVARCTLKNHHKEGIDAKVGSRNGSIHHNVVYGGAQTISNQQGSPGIYVDAYRANSFNIDVYNNTVYNNNNTGGIEIWDEKPLDEYFDHHTCRVFNNVIYGQDHAWGRGIKIGRDWSNVEVFNNTVIGNTIGIEVFESANNVTVANNIVLNNSYYDIILSSATSVVHNNLTETIKNQVQAQNVYDNITGDPKFVDILNHDYHLLPSSPAIDVAVTPFVADFDFDNLSRPAGLGYDMGAYEYGGTIPDYLEVSPLSLSYGSSASSQSLSVTSNISWTASESLGWVSLDYYNGTGNQSVLVSVTENSTGISRNGNITFSGPGVNNVVISVTQAAVQTTYTLNTTALNGTVSKDPNKADYTEGEIVTLTASPVVGYQFDGWSGDLTGTQNPVDITMNADKNITANFVVAQVSSLSHQWLFNGNGNDEIGNNNATLLNGAGYTTGFEGQALNLNGAGSNQHASVGTISFNQEFSIVLRAKNPGTQTHQNWLVSNSQTNGFKLYVNKYGSTNGEVVFETKSSSGTDHSTSAAGAFPFNQWNHVAVSVESSGAYKIYVNAVQVHSGTVKTGTPFNQPVYIGSQGNGNTWNTWIGQTDDVRIYDSALNASEISALYQNQTTYTLSVTAINGTVTKNPNKADYTEGEVVTLTATPDAGYQFDGWSGDLTGTQTPVDITMNGNKSVTANFSLIPSTTYTLSVTAINGTVTKNPDKADYTEGEVVTLTATPDAGYQFDGWSGDLTGTQTPVDITMNANKSVTANFSLIPSSTYTLSVTAINGTVTKNPNKADYTEGEVVTLTATPDAGYQFDGWSGDLTGTQNPVDITMNANKNITANFVVAQVSSLSHQWLFNGNGNDEIGNKNATLLNGAGYTTGFEGQALNLNGAGSNQHASVGTISFNQEFTIVLRAKNPGNQTHQNWLVSNRQTNGFRLYVNKYGSTDGVVAFETKSSSGTDYSTTAAGAFPFNQWNHVAVSVESSGAYKIYVNAVQVHSGTVKTGTPFNQPIYIGSQGNGETWNTWKGQTDDVRIYDSALNASEITTLFNGGEQTKSTSLIMSVKPNNENSMVKVYPNPCQNGLLNVQVPDNNGYVTLYNIMGQVMYKSAVNSIDNVIDVKDFRSGMYIVKVNSDDRVETIKVYIK